MLKSFKKLEEETTNHISNASSYDYNFLNIKNSIKSIISGLELFKLHLNVESLKTLVRDTIKPVQKIKDSTTDPVVFFRASIYIDTLNELQKILELKNVEQIKFKIF